LFMLKLLITELLYAITQNRDYVRLKKIILQKEIQKTDKQIRNLSKNIGG